MLWTLVYSQHPLILLMVIGADSMTPCTHWARVQSQLVLIWVTSVSWGGEIFIKK